MQTVYINTQQQPCHIPGPDRKTVTVLPQRFKDRDMDFGGAVFEVEGEYFARFLHPHGPLTVKESVAEATFSDTPKVVVPASSGDDAESAPDELEPTDDGDDDLLDDTSDSDAPDDPDVAEEETTADAAPASSVKPRIKIKGRRRAE